MKLSRRKGKCHRAVWTLIQSQTIFHIFQVWDGFKDSYENNLFGNSKVMLRMLTWLLTGMQSSGSLQRGQLGNNCQVLFLQVLE